MAGGLTIATALSVGGVASSFVLFWYLLQALGLSHETVQILIFLKLLVAGHLTMFLARNEGWFWEKPWPSLPLFVALEGTQVVGTLCAVYGWLVHPVGWAYAAAVWGYSIVWMFINDALKVGAYRILRRA